MTKFLVTLSTDEFINIFYFDEAVPEIYHNQQLVLSLSRTTDNYNYIISGLLKDIYNKLVVGCGYEIKNGSFTYHIYVLRENIPNTKRQIARHLIDSISELEMECQQQLLLDDSETHW